MVTASNKFDIDRQRVLRDIGYAPDSEPSVRMVSLVDEYIENAHQFIAPSFSYLVRDIVLVTGNNVIIEYGVIFESEVIARLLEKANLETHPRDPLPFVIYEGKGEYRKSGAKPPSLKSLPPLLRNASSGEGDKGGEVYNKYSR